MFQIYKIGTYLHRVYHLLFAKFGRPQAESKPRSTQVFKQGLAKSIHHARVLIRQRHIRVGRQICDIPSFCVRSLNLLIFAAKLLQISQILPICFGLGSPP